MPYLLVVFPPLPSNNAESVPDQDFSPPPLYISMHDGLISSLHKKFCQEKIYPSSRNSVYILYTTKLVFGDGSGHGEISDS